MFCLFQCFWCHSRYGTDIWLLTCLLAYTLIKREGKGEPVLFALLSFSDCFLKVFRFLFFSSGLLRSLPTVGWGLILFTFISNYFFVCCDWVKCFVCLFKGFVVYFERLSSCEWVSQRCPSLALLCLCGRPALIHLMF